MAPPTKLVTMVDADGNPVQVPEDQVAAASSQGLHAQSDAEHVQQASTDIRLDSSRGIGGAIKAGGAAFARGLTVGGSDAILGGLGYGQDLANLKEANPNLSTGLDVVGAIAPTILSGGATAPESAAELALDAGRIGEGAIGAGEAGAGLAAAGDAAAAARGPLSAALSYAPSSLVSRMGAATSKAFGGGYLGRLAGGATEGGIFGAGNAVSQLALSDDPLTAEHVASTLGSNVLLGAGVGGAFGLGSHLVERGLSSAAGKLAEASAAKEALAAVPEDLAGFDDAGLRDAGKTAAAEHEADKAAERASLEQLRVEQRAELANQVRDLHADLETERPIFQAVQGDDVAKIPGVNNIKAQLADSWGSIRRALKGETAIAENPMSVVRPLQMRVDALTALQEKSNELRGVLGSDTRANALEHVNEALEQTKEQIAAIKQLSPKTPVASGRLTMLESGPSPRMQSIADARAALGNAPELGLAAKGAKAVAFGGVTALAHMIPGAGVVAPFLGHAAGEAVGRLFGRLGNGVTDGLAKSSAALKDLLSVGERVTPFVPLAASKVLGSVRFGQGVEAKSDELADLFHARAAELRSQTMYAPDGSVQMRPEARQALAAKLDPIRTVNPVLADKVEDVAARRVAYVSSKIPRQPDIAGLQLGPNKWQPSDMEIRAFARTVRAAEDPHSVEQRLAQGTVTPDEAAAYRAVYPERFAQLQQAVTAAAPLLAKTLPMKKKVALFTFTGIPTTAALQPNVLAVLQGNFAAEPGSAGGTQAPKPMPSFGAFGTPRSMDKPTPAQAREGG